MFVSGCKKGTPTNGLLVGEGKNNTSDTMHSLKGRCNLLAETGTNTLTPFSLSSKHPVCYHGDKLLFFPSDYRDTWGSTVEPLLKNISEIRTLYQLFWSQGHPSVVGRFHFTLSFVGTYYVPKPCPSSHNGPSSRHHPSSRHCPSSRHLQYGQIGETWQQRLSEAWERDDRWGMLIIITIVTGSNRYWLAIV